MTAITSHPQSSRPHWATPSVMSQWSDLPVRLIVGYGFIAHGYAKWSRGPETFAVVLQTLGVPVPFLLSWVTTLVELLGGFCVLIGAFVPLVSIPMATVLLAAMGLVHLRYGFFSVKLVEVAQAGIKFGTVGYEIILLYLAALASLAVRGAGPLSVDRWRKRQKEERSDRQGAHKPDIFRGCDHHATAFNAASTIGE